MPSTSTVKPGTRWQRRRTGKVREVVGFTRKPDGNRRARLSDGYTTTSVLVDQITKTYRPLS